MSEKELKITEGAVLRAAGKCGTAKEVLKELFPEAFKEEGWEDVTDKAYLTPSSNDETLLICVNDDMCGRDTLRVEPLGGWSWGPKISQSGLKLEKGRLWRKKKS